MHLVQIPQFNRENLPALFRIGGFVLITICPLMGWLLFGGVEPYGRPHTEFPSLRALIEESKFDALGSAILDRSIIRRTAIQLQYSFDFDVLHNLDTSLALSGKDGWLFVKDDFWGGKCLDPEQVRPLLTHVDAIVSMAKAAGLHMVMSISPDKSSVFPEKLDPANRRYWNCKKENGELWRRLSQVESPSLVDHLVPLRAAKRERSPKLYFKRDTHWTPYGAAISFRQLVSKIFANADVEHVPLRITGNADRVTDLSRMLLLHQKEQYDVVEDPIGTMVQDKGRAVFVHDSFYKTLSDQIAQVFPNSLDLTYRDQDRFASVLKDADLVVVNSVERSIIWELKDGWLRGDGPLMQAVLARNTAAAADCSNFRSVKDDNSQKQTGGQSSTVDEGQSIMVTVPQLAKGISACLTLRLEDWSNGLLELSLPKNAPGENEFTPGRSVVYPAGAGKTIAMVLPEYVQGHAVKINVPPGSLLTEFELGERASPPVAAKLSRD
jgi:hypothetical protein